MESCPYLRYILKKKKRKEPTYSASQPEGGNSPKPTAADSQRRFLFGFVFFFAQDQFARIQPTQTSGRQKLQKRSALLPAKRSTSFSSTPVRVQSCRLRARCPSRESTTDLWIRPRVLLSLPTRN